MGINIYRGYVLSDEIIINFINIEGIEAYEKLINEGWLHIPSYTKESDCYLFGLLVEKNIEDETLIAVDERSLGGSVAQDAKITQELMRNFSNYIEETVRTYYPRYFVVYNI